MRVPLTQLLLTTAVFSTAMSFATTSGAAAPAPSCPQDVAFTYHEKWLVIAASSSDEGQAKAIASQASYCLIGKDSFLGLKPDTFVVVAAAKETRKQPAPLWCAFASATRTPTSNSAPSGAVRVNRCQPRRGRS